MRTITYGVGVTLTLVAVGCASNARPVTRDRGAQFTDGFDANVRRDVERLRGATNKYHDPAAAEAAGYPNMMPMPKCIADSTMGAMGHHLIDRKAIDDKLEIEHPEMLIYASDAEGRPELVAVEYIMPFRVLPATEKPPRLFGQEFKRYDQYNYWGLHVWAWRRNAAGLFADWNPNVKC